MRRCGPFRLRVRILNLTIAEPGYKWSSFFESGSVVGTHSRSSADTATWSQYNREFPHLDLVRTLLGSPSGIFMRKYCPNSELPDKMNIYGLWVY